MVENISGNEKKGILDLYFNIFLKIHENKKVWHDF
jgi:hypothetical protein